MLRGHIIKTVLFYSYDTHDEHEVQLLIWDFESNILEEVFLQICLHGQEVQQLFPNGFFCFDKSLDADFRVTI